MTLMMTSHLVHHLQSKIASKVGEIKTLTQGILNDFMAVEDRIQVYGSAAQLDDVIDVTEFPIRRCELSALQLLQVLATANPDWSIERVTTEAERSMAMQPVSPQERQAQRVIIAELERMGAGHPMHGDLE